MRREDRKPNDVRGSDSYEKSGTTFTWFDIFVLSMIVLLIFGPSIATALAST